MNSYQLDGIIMAVIVNNIEVCHGCVSLINKQVRFQQTLPQIRGLTYVFRCLFSNSSNTVLLVNVYIPSAYTSSRFSNEESDDTIPVLSLVDSYGLPNICNNADPSLPLAASFPLLLFVWQQLDLVHPSNQQQLRQFHTK